MKINKSLTIIIIILALAVAGFWLLKSGIQDKESAINDEQLTANIQQQAISYDQLTEEEIKEVEQQEVQQYKAASTGSGLAASNLEKYQSDQGFSFWHPGFEVSTVPDQAGELITFDKGPVGLQIFIVSFDEPGPITPQRIKQDLPSLEMKDIQYATLDGVEAVFFNSNSGDLDTYEAWIINNDRLYQVMTYQGMEDFLHEVMNTWKWN